MMGQMETPEEKTGQKDDNALPKEVMTVVSQMSSDQLQMLVQFCNAYCSSPVLRENLSFLSTQPLSVYQRMTIARAMMEWLDFHRYRIWEEFPQDKWKPRILTSDETIARLLDKPCSIARFGDGEFESMLGHDMIFQQADANLSELLKKALEDKGEACLIGLPESYYHKTSDEGNDFANEWYWLNTARYRSIIDRYACHEKQYCSSEFTCRYVGTKEQEADHIKAYFDRLMSLFAGRKLILFAGERVFRNITYNVFARAAEVQLVLCPTENAFSRFGDILHTARQYDSSEYVMGFILGPTATAAAYVLAQEGYLAWDIGHLAKAYDVYRKKMPATNENVFRFFQRD